MPGFYTQPNFNRCDASSHIHNYVVEIKDTSCNVLGTQSSFPITLLAFNSQYTPHYQPHYPPGHYDPYNQQPNYYSYGYAQAPQQATNTHYAYAGSPQSTSYGYAYHSGGNYPPPPPLAQSAQADKQGQSYMLHRSYPVTAVSKLLSEIKHQHNCCHV